MVFEYTIDYFHLVLLNHGNIIINLISLENNFSAQELIELQDNFKAQGKKVVHLWEDVWVSRTVQVLFRLKSLSGENKRIHGRKTKVKKIAQPEAEFFLNENHLQGSVNSRYKFGLFLSEELVAVATFSALRKMNHTKNYKSVELIRFAVKAGFSITGGFSKLIKNAKELLNPNDIMTYADRDWSAGAAYIKLGFEETAVLGPQYFLLDENFNRKLNKANLINNNCKVFNTGSIKFILKF